jgi:RND superfamily putative drug exporter
MGNDRFKILGHWLIHNRWWVLSCWCLLAISGSFLSSKVDGILEGSTRVPGGQSEAVKQILKNKFGNRFGHELVFIFYSKTRRAEDVEFRQTVENIQLGLRDSLKINSINTYYDTNSSDLVSPDGHSILGIAELDVADVFNAQQAVPELREIVKNCHVPGWMDVYITGEGATFYDIIQSSSRDAFWAEVHSFPVIVIILIFTFGALLAAGIPVILGLTAVTIALGIVFLIGRHYSMFIIAKNAVSMIGLGVGIDYSLFMVSRFREELKNGVTREDAAASIMSTSGKTVLFSGTTVIIGLASVFIAGIPFLNSMAIAAIAVVIVAVLAALTLLPVLLFWIGPAINWPPFISSFISRSKSGRLWHHLALNVMKQPMPYFLGTMFLLLLLAVPLLHIKTYTPTVVGLPRGAESRLGFERLQTDFVAGKMSPLNIVVEAPPGESIWSADSVERLYRFSRLIAADRRTSKVEGVVDIDSKLTLADYQKLYCGEGGLAGSDNIFAQMVGSYVDNSGNNRQTLLRVTTFSEPGSLVSREMVKIIRTKMIPAVFGDVGYRVLVGGGSAGEVDLDQLLMGKLPLIIGLVCLITFLVLVILFRSILIPLKSIFMNILSVLASFGLLVLVFQDGVLGSLAIFRAPGGISSVIMVMLFAVLFGLSMDYEIFLTLRMKEEHDKGRSNEESVAWGLEKTGGLVTSAALIMVAVFGAFALTSMMMTQEFGLGLAAAVLLDASIIRVLLMPATMRLLGEWNWWFPERVGAMLPRIDIKEL